MSQLEENIGQFKDFVDIWKTGYRFALFSYIAFNATNRSPTLIVGNIQLMPLLDTSKIEFFTHTSKSITAGITHWEISDDPLSFLAYIANGAITLPNGQSLRLCNEGNKDIWSQFNPGIESLKQNQPRAASLRLSGGEIDDLFVASGGFDELDGELQSSQIPFNGIGDLCSTLGLSWYQFGNPVGHKSVLSINADNVLQLNRAQSLISGTEARIGVLMGSGLNRDQVRIGIRTWEGNYSGRKSISGNQFTWSEENDISKASVETNVGDTPAVLVLLTYADKLLDRWWIFNPAKHINHNYAAYHAIDNNLSELKKFISGESKNPGDDLETGIAFLLSIFRFTVFHYGLTKTLREAPDLLAFTEDNHLAVIECTTGIPNENNKISKLITRTEKIREVLSGSGNNHVEILPVIVTTSLRGAVQKDIEEAGKHGVVVVAKENINSLLERVQFPPPLPSQLFSEAKSLLPTPAMSFTDQQP